MSAFVRRPLPLYLLLCAVAALWIDLSRIHLGQNSDSLIPVLASLQHWTPFYWEQSRFGMLVPLVAMPFQKPLVNLLVQDGLMIFAGLAAIGLLARFLIRSSTWLGIACASCAVFLGCLAEPLRCDYLIAQPYGVSFSLGLGALLLVERNYNTRCLCLSLGLLLLASWVNLAVGPALLLIVFARWCGQRLTWRRAPIRLAALILIATLCGVAWERWAPYRDVRVTRFAAAGRWLESSQTLVENALHQGGPAYRHALAALLGAGLLGAILAARRERNRAAMTLATFVGAAWLLVLFAASGRWTALNCSMPRYVYMAMLALQTGLIAALTLTIRGWRFRGERRGASSTWLGARSCRAYASTFAVLLSVGFSYGMPSLATVRSSLDARLGTKTDAILRDGCTHIAGDYWRVWPAVFHANWMLRERGATGAVWGVTYRSLPTEHFWARNKLDDCRIVLLGEDAHARQLLHRHFSFALADKDRKISKSQ